MTSNKRISDLINRGLSSTYDVVENFFSEDELRKYVMNRVVEIVNELILRILGYERSRATGRIDGVKAPLRLSDNLFTDAIKERTQQIADDLLSDSSIFVLSQTDTKKIKKDMREYYINDLEDSLHDMIKTKVDAYLHEVTDDTFAEVKSIVEQWRINNVNK